MRAVTVQQPWAWAIIHGGKAVENRTRIGTWRPTVGQRIAIHAGLRWSERGARSGLIWDALARVGWSAGPNALRDDPRGLLTFGAIIGTVEVADVHPDADCCNPWGEASYTEHGGGKRVDVVHLVLETPRAVGPIPCRGALGLWTLPEDIAAVLR